MGGYIIDTDADKLVRKGKREGQKNVASLMSYLAENGRNDDIVRAGKDEKFLDQLLAEFYSGKKQTT